MFRVYFDWNVYSNLRRKGINEEPFISLKTFLERNRDRLTLVYSAAHLQDLQRSYDKSEKGRIETELDLSFLESMTNSHCLYQEHKDKSAKAVIIKPEEYFDEIIENTKFFSDFDFENIISEDDNPEIASLWKSYLSLMKSIPSGLNLNHLEKLPEKYQGVKKYLKNTSIDNSHYSLFTDILDFFQSTDKEQTDLYKSVRNTAINDMKIDTDPRNWGDAFDYLDMFFKKNRINKTFQEVIEETLNSSKKKEDLTRFDYFLNYYISLDTFGYYRDKKMSNLVDDATHAYYGAYCDFFVTDDDNTYNKAKAIYKKFNIETAVCKANEFMHTFYSFAYITPLGDKGLLDEVIHLMDTSFLLLGGFDNKMNHADIHKIDKLLLDYFNRMQVNHYDEVNRVCFYKRRKNYSSIYFWTEIENLVNKLFLNLGVDVNMRGEFTKKDKEEIYERKWAGRLWGDEKIVIAFDEQEEPFGWVLKIESIKK